MKKIICLQISLLLKTVTFCFFLSILNANSGVIPINETDPSTDNVYSKKTFVRVYSLDEEDNFSYLNEKYAMNGECATKFSSYKTCVFIINAGTLSLVIDVDDKQQTFIEAKQKGFLLNEDTEIDYFNLKIKSYNYPIQLYNGKVSNKSGLVCLDSFCEAAGLENEKL